MGRTVPGSGLPDRLRDNGGMLAIVFALASAISYGGSDFAAGLAARSVSVIQVTLVASAAALLAVAAAMPFAAAHPPAAAALAETAIIAGRATMIPIRARVLGRSPQSRPASTENPAVPTALSGPATLNAA